LIFILSLRGLGSARVHLLAENTAASNTQMQGNYWPIRNGITMKLNAIGQTSLLLRGKHAQPCVCGVSMRLDAAHGASA
jgi:hypothetical protein